MTSDSQWDARWRQGHAQSRYSDTRHNPPTPDESATSLKTSAATPSYPSPWREGYSAADQRYDTQRTSAVAGSCSDWSYQHPSPHRRHTPPSSTATATSPPRQQITGSWQSLPPSPHAHQKYISSAPLTLQIPETHDLPRISSDKHSYLQTPLSRQQTGTSLPPFSSIQEHARGIEEPDEVEIAPMSARLSCYQCTKLEPLIREVAVAVAELDELVQTSCRDTVTRTLDIPTRDGTVSIVHWMLGRLGKAKGDLQQASAWNSGTQQHPRATHGYTSAISHDMSPPNMLKRAAWGHEDLPNAKRRRSGAFVDDGPRATSGSAPKDERRASVDFNTDSPQPAESISGSAFARPGSPGTSSRYQRTFPSPSSLAYPLSSAPSALPQAAQSLGSPALSYQPPGSVHTTSTSSATSAHLKDLQHQVSLKTMAYDTLQSEYTSLLQKLQRERIKSQTIEKKTTVADQEVNDLTSRNEELAEQVKSLETQLEACERKRDDDRSQAAREKEQWQQMLDLASRIQNKHAEEKQKLRGELDLLAQRGTSPASMGSAGAREGPQDRSSGLALVSMPPASAVENNSLQPTYSRESNPGTSSTPAGDTLGVRRQIDALNSRIEVLTFALEETRRYNELLNDHGNEFMNRSEQIRVVVQRALEDDSGLGTVQSTMERSLLPTAPRDVQALRHHATTRDIPSSATVTAGSSGSALASLRDDPRKVSHSTASSSNTLVSIARAVSPGPAELGFHVTPSTSSPEEIVQALGPVPAPIPTLPNFGAAFEAPKSSPPPKKKQTAPSKRSKQPRRQSVDVINTWTLPPRMPDPQENSNDPNIATQLGSFRPQSTNHHHVLPSLPSSTHGGPPDTIQQPRRSPPSHHSSPGPQRDGTSPSGSAGSAGESGAGEKLQLPSLSQLQYATRNGNDEGRATEHVTVMPPPPRPAVATSGAYGGGREYRA